MTLDRMKLSAQTVRDNIAILEEVQEPDDAGYYLQLEHEKVVFECIEKQIPKKPKKETWVDDEKHKGNVRLATKNDILTKDNHTTIRHCPNCGEGLTVAKYLSPPKYDLYCRQCGQAIDWSDTE